MQTSDVEARRLLDALAKPVHIEIQRVPRGIYLHGFQMDGPYMKVECKLGSAGGCRL